MPIRYTLRQLEYLVAVGEAGSIAHASAALNVSSPSISAAIAQLEREFGLPLFVRRHAHGLSLTPAGRVMLDQARTVLREADRLADIAGDIAGVPRGALSVGCLLTIAQIVLPGVRRSFEQAFPEIRITQFELDQAEIYSRIRRAEIDLALTYDLDIPADLRFVTLAELTPHVLVGETHPLAGRAAVSVEELIEYPMVLLDLPFSAEYFMSFFTRHGARPRIAERTRDMGVMRSLVANGYGYSIANIRLASALSPDGRRLRMLPLSGQVRPLRLGLLTAAEAESLVTIRSFMTHLRQMLAAGEVPGIADPRDRS